MPVSLLVAIVVVGATGIAGQIVLTRELLVCFFGNELSLGLIMACWLLLEAAGSWLGGRLTREGRGTWDKGHGLRISHPSPLTPRMSSLSLFAVVAGAAALALPATIYLARVVRPVLHITSGEVIGPPAMFAISLLVLLPVSLLHGAGFTLGIRAAEETGRGDAPLARGNVGAPGAGNPAGLVYLVETLGSIVGGVLLSLLLIGRLGSFQIALLVGAMNFIALGVLVPGGACRHREARAWFPVAPVGTAKREPGTGNRELKTLSAILALAAIAALALGLPATLDRASLQRLYPGEQVAYYANSHYGNITVLKRAEQYTFLLDGTPAITLPTPDYEFVENFAHISMLSHSNPRRVLLIGGGIGGVLAELLKYPEVRIDYCELDPALVAVVRRFFPDRPELNDPRISLKTTDGRRQLQAAPAGTYDVILVGSPGPTTLQANRYFSTEFMRLARSRLTETGILAGILPGSTAYLSDELARLNRLQLDGLQSVFPDVRVVPGDMNVFLGSNSPFASFGPELLGRRLSAYGFSTRIMSPEYLDTRLTPLAEQQFRQRLASVSDRGSVIGDQGSGPRHPTSDTRPLSFGTKHPTPLNSDRRPISVIAALAYWTSLSNPRLARLLDELAGSSRSALPYALPGTIVALAIALFLASHQRRRFALHYAIFSTGLAGATVSVMALLLVQITAGAMYFYLALVTTCFMAGAAAGSAWSSRRTEREFEIPNPRHRTSDSVFYRLEIGVGLIGIVLVSADLLVALPVSLIIALILLITGAAGFFVGAEYPLANQMQRITDPGRNVADVPSVPFPIRRPDTRSVASAAGTLYAADLLGGFLGALTLPLFLLPIIGLLPTALTVAALKLLGVAMLAQSAGN